jgi:vacuolar protein sorting-associated protein 52
MLQSKAVERIREFLLTKVSSLQRPNTNIPIMQQTFLRYKKFFEALMEYNVDVGVEIKTRYVEIVSNIFSTQFKTYLNGLLKCKPDDATRHDLLGVADASRSRSAGLFALGDRFALVSEMVAHISSSSEHDAPTKSVSSLSQSMALPPSGTSSSHAVNNSPRKPGHSRSNSQSGAVATEEKPTSSLPPAIGPNPIILAAASDHKKYNFEWIFHSMQLVLLDTVSSEILFQREFFSFDLFQQVFANATAAAEEILDNYLNNTYDCVALLLMIILVERDLRVMSHRGVPSLDPYLARCTNKLLTRLLHLIDANVQSLKGAKPQDMITVFDVRPHVVTRRYAELIVAVNVLCSKMENHISASRIVAKMKLLCAQTKDLLLRISSIELDEIKRSVFLINNYDLILGVLKERSIEMAPEAADFGEMFDVEVISCVELELNVYFGKMITFVKKKTQQPDLKVTAEVINGFVKEFSTQWKEVLKKISADMMTLFSNFTTGGRVLQKTFAQLVLYYKRFEDLVKNNYKELFSRISADFVPISAMTYEMKQYTSALNF